MNTKLVESLESQVFYYFHQRQLDLSDHQHTSISNSTNKCSEFDTFAVTLVPINEFGDRRGPSHRSSVESPSFICISLVIQYIQEYCQNVCLLFSFGCNVLYNVHQHRHWIRSADTTCSVLGLEVVDDLGDVGSRGTRM